MNTRLLPLAEWDRLAVTGLPPFLPHVRPEDINVVVVEEDGKIVASLAVMRMTHWEAAWVDKDRRGNGGIVRALLKGAVEASRPFTSHWVIAQADQEHVKDILSRLGGVKIPDVESYVMRLGDN